MKFIGNLFKNTPEEQRWNAGNDYWMAELVTPPQMDRAEKIASQVFAAFNAFFPKISDDRDSELEINLTKEGGASISFPNYNEYKSMNSILLGAGTALGKKPTLTMRTKKSWGHGDSHPAGRIEKECVEFATLRDFAQTVEALARGLEKNQAVIDK